MTRIKGTNQLLFSGIIPRHFIFVGKKPTQKGSESSWPSKASLATAGSGDVLAGILAGTLATMRDEMDRWELLYSYAVALHSYAGFAAAWDGLQRANVVFERMKARGTEELGN